MAQIRWTFNAEGDLKSIHEYISLDSEFYAIKIVDRIYARALILESQMYVGRVVPEFAISTVRELIEGNYRIIYEIDGDSMVSILRVFHVARLLKYL
jgi:toxin ParE1/3/4